MSQSLLTIILAAGKGTRMCSNLPKVAHKLAGKPLIAHLLDTLAINGITHRNIIYGYQGEYLKSIIDKDYPDIQWYYQAEQLGTAHAVKQALPSISEAKRVLILLGDTPLVSANTLKKFILYSEGATGCVLTTKKDNPYGYGRVIKSRDCIKAIIEEKDLDESQKSLDEVNSGIMIFDAKFLIDYLSKITNENAQQEYYLTDLIRLANQDKLEIRSYCVEDEQEVSGINDKVQLAEAESYLRNVRAKQILVQGVTLIDPQRFDLQGELIHGKDVIIEPNVLLKGRVVLGDNVTIGMGSILENCQIGSGSSIEAYSIIHGSQVGSNCQIGPFARLRPETNLKDNVKIGNFVEVKKSMIDNGSKVNHLSYIGDAELGKNINIGAGSITCNYDGVNKFKTVIEDNVFVGSNTAMIAPINIHQGATIGAGSVISKDVKSNGLTFTRAPLSEKTHWQRPSKIEK